MVVAVLLRVEQPKAGVRDLVVSFRVRNFFIPLA